MLENINERFERFFQSTGLSQPEFGRLYGLSKDVVNNVIKQRSKVSIELIVALAEEGKVNIHWLLTGEGDMHATSQGIREESHIPYGAKSGNSSADNLCQWLRYFHAKNDEKLLHWLETEIAGRFPAYNEWRKSEGMEPVRLMGVEGYLYDQLTPSEQSHIDRKRNK